jgi:hypothetical protein
MPPIDNDRNNFIDNGMGRVPIGGRYDVVTFGCGEAEVRWQIDFGTAESRVWKQPSWSAGAMVKNRRHHR